MEMKMASDNVFTISVMIIGIFITLSYSGQIIGPTPRPTQTHCPKRPGFLYPDQGSCSLYYSCKSGIFDLRECPFGTVFSEIVGACVPFNSLMDTCSRNNYFRACKQFWPKDMTFRDPSRFWYLNVTIPHPTECQRYILCHTYMGPGLSMNRHYDKDCTYPDLFDMTDRTCKSFKKAFCGPHRIAGIDGCDYASNRCGMCMDCAQLYPTCRGKPDGFNAYAQREWTSYYILCDTERFVNYSECSRPTGVFDPEQRKCVSSP